MSSRWPELVPFFFKAVSKLDRDRKLQWLTRTLRLDDQDWQLVVDLLSAAWDDHDNKAALAVLDRLDVEVAGRPTRTEVIAFVRRSIAAAGFAAMMTTDGAMWTRRVGAYRLWVTASEGGLGEDPDTPYMLTVTTFDRLVPVLLALVAEDLKAVLALADEAAGDPAGFITVRTARLEAA